MSPSLRALFAVAIALFLMLAPAADARELELKASSETQHWASARAYTSPYALVDVFNDGQRLRRLSFDRCRSVFADAEIAVRASTCGRRWRLRLSYVSLNGQRERFRVRFAPVSSAGPDRAR
jgi:hypothetical protein